MGIAISNLPSGSSAYDRAYEEAMRRILGQSDEQRLLALDVLAWITCSQRPMLAKELQQGLSVSSGDVKLDEDNFPDIDDMISVCAGLVTLDGEGGVIRLVHYTTQEYFERTQSRWFPSAEDEVALRCLSYLSLREFESWKRAEIHEVSVKYPLHNYAALFWGLHVRRSRTVEKQVIKIFQKYPHMNHLTYMLEKRGAWPVRWYHSRNYGPPSTLFHLAAHFGLSQVVNDFIDSRAALNSEDMYGWTALTYAARSGHLSIVKLLIERGADINRPSYSDYTPLHHAASAGHVPVVKLLIAREDLGIDLSKPSRGSALCCAAENGHRETVELLHDSKPRYCHTNEAGQMPLHLASSNGHVDVVHSLQVLGDYINCTDNDNKTPLILAAEGGHTSVIKTLLEEPSVNINERAQYMMSPLSLVRGMLTSEDDLYTAGDTALESTKRWGYSEIVHLLEARAHKQTAG